LSTNLSINIPEIGTVNVTRNSRAKRIILKVRPFEGIRLTLPPNTTMITARSFVLGKKQWLLKQLTRVRQDEAQIRKMQATSPNISREEARRILKERLNALARTHGFQYKRLFIRRQKTRWGSCSAKNNINLNMYVSLLPKHLIDYVLLHELLHTRIKNHSQKFWQELSKFVHEPKVLREQLKKFEFYLY